MRKIEKKVWPEYFDAILSGKKRFELRLNEFDAEEGDVLVLKEWDPEKEDYTGREVEKKITHLFKFKTNDLFWSEDEVRDKGLVIMSIE